MSYVYKRENFKDEEGRLTVLHCVVYLDPDPDRRPEPVAELEDHDQALRLVNYMNGGSGQPFDWDLEEATVTVTPGATTEAGKGDDEAQGVDTV